MAITFVSGQPKLVFLSVQYVAVSPLDDTYYMSIGLQYFYVVKFFHSGVGATMINIITISAAGIQTNQS